MICISGRAQGSTFACVVCRVTHSRHANRPTGTALPLCGMNASCLFNPSCVEDSQVFASCQLHSQTAHAISCPGASLVSLSLVTHGPGAGPVITRWCVAGSLWLDCVLMKVSALCALPPRVEPEAPCGNVVVCPGMFTVAQAVDHVYTVHSPDLGI